LTSELERIKILEGKISRIVDYVHKINEENKALKQQLKELKLEKKDFMEQAKKASKLDDSVKKYQEERDAVKDKIEAIINQIDELEI
jgi:seryl-tRNA synthetase